ncbi:MAG TPA: MarR family transcriptional regulator [Ramlibacter sp.]|nr:MarR family transcriptional regulator [Ramlibacter sp.]
MPTRTPAFHSLLSYQVTSTSDAMRRGAALRLQREHGLSLAQWRVLAMISASEPVQLRELAAFSEADKGQVSRIVASLVERQLVQRKAHAKDARSWHLALTEAGKAVARAAEETSRERDHEFRSCFTPAEAAQFAAMLARLKARALVSEEEEKDRARRGR